jgi:four helix bundle protein
MSGKIKIQSRRSKVQSPLIFNLTLITQEVDMAKVKKFEEIQSWQKGRELANEVYRVTNIGSFARDFGLRDQIRRAAISIISNIAEGFERGGDREFIQFLSIAKGSAGELRSQLYIALDQRYITVEEFNQMAATATETIS